MIRSRLSTRQLASMLVILALGTGCATTGTRLEPDQLHKRLPGNIAQDIEQRLIHIVQPDKLQNVYYLARMDPTENRVFVGYFLEWSGEFPDFGRKYPISRTERWQQVRIPIFYTNWLYIPRSGGLQRRMFGPGDVEGITVAYELVGDSLGQLLAIGFEMPGHKAMTIPDSTDEWSVQDVVSDGAPFLQLASWNHMFKPPAAGSSPQIFHVQPFPDREWSRLKMNRRRAEIAKRGLSDSTGVP
ncbi:hypothetical protein ACFL45_04715 [Candidatus Neomarinimicrobiota bacterium]